MADNSLFDWRDYIRIESDTYYVDASGKPTAKFDEITNPERRKEILRDYQAVRANERLVEKTLDQISLTPDVQAAIKKAHAVLQGKIKNDPALAKESGGQLRIELGGGRTDFNSESGIVQINPQDFGKSQYKTANGFQDFSLQQALIHELEHGGDKSLGPTKDLAQMKASIKAAVNSVLQYYPELREEYAKNQTLMGQPVGKLLAAPNLESFQKIYNNDVLRGAHITIPTNELADYVKKNAGPENKMYGMLGVLNTAYNNEHDRLMVAQDEMPVIKATNAILKKYFKDEPARDGYDTRENPNQKGAPLSFDRTQPSLAGYVHPDLPTAGLVPTRYCHRAVLSTCEATHISGASYNEKPKPGEQAPSHAKPPVAPAP